MSGRHGPKWVVAFRRNQWSPSSEICTKIPELLLVTAIAWCFLISGIAGEAGLSKEMGALVAGVSLSTFPFNIDIIAKVINIRDFFVTLFFVGLGLQIPMPTVSLFAYAALVSLFLVATRFTAVFPVLFSMKNGLRASLIPSINLSQMSEFSLVIASLGLGFGHIDSRVVGILTFVFAITSVLSTYMIQYNHEIQAKLSSLFKKFGLRDIDKQPTGGTEAEESKEIVFLGFFREASSIFHEIELLQDGDRNPLSERVLVVDFNPVVHCELNKREVKCIYGDISSVDTLKHAHVGFARTVVCTIPDSILRGITNEKLLHLARRLCPQAQVIVTADTLQTAKNLYELGADFVFIPRIHSARHVAGIVLESLTERLDKYRETEIADLRVRHEVLG